MASKVYYNGACPVCNAGIKDQRSRMEACGITDVVWIDVHAKPEAAAEVGATLEMPSLLAFLHHVAAFALVAALAIEFVVIKDELSISNIRRLAVADLIFGISAGVILIVGLMRVFLFREGCDVLLPLHAIHRQARALRHNRTAVDLSHHPVPVVEKIR